MVDFDASPDAGPGGGTGAAPTVTSTLPTNGATGVALNASISATFSEAMDPATLGPTTFIVKQGTTTVSGAVTFDGATHSVTFTPAAALGTTMLYTATITTGAKDLEAPRWRRTTRGPSPPRGSAAPPTVISTTPLDLATNVSINKRPTATFSKAMDPLRSARRPSRWCRA